MLSNTLATQRSSATPVQIMSVIAFLAIGTFQVTDLMMSRPSLIHVNVSNFRLTVTKTLNIK